MTIDNNDNDNDNNNHYCYDQYDHLMEINIGSVSRFGDLAPPPPPPPIPKSWLGKWGNCHLNNAFSEFCRYM